MNTRLFLPFVCLGVTVILCADVSTDQKGESRRKNTSEGIVVNVKDFGAKGDGVTDDTAAIQAAVDHKTGARGVIFFPPGVYITSKAITFRNTGSPVGAANPILPESVNIYFSGCGHASELRGNFAGYILDRDPDAGNGDRGGHVIEKLRIRNMHKSGGGIRLSDSLMATIQQCNIQAHTCIDLADNNFSIAIRDCDIVGHPGGIADQSYGIIVSSGNQTTIQNCDITGHYNGVRAPFGLMLTGCRIEMNHVGLMLGMDRQGGTQPAGCTILSNSFESNDTAIYCNSVVGSLFSQLSIQGSDYAPQADGKNGTSHYGIRLHNSHGNLFAGISSGSEASVAQVAFTANPPVKTTFVNCEIQTEGPGKQWKLHDEPVGLQFTNCNNPPVEISVAQLPAEPVPGLMFNVKDARSADPGSTVEGGGAHHVTVIRSNGTWRAL